MKNKIRNLTKGRKFYLLLCWAMLFSLFVGAPGASSAAPRGIAVETFTAVDFVENPQCFTVQISGTSVQYNNSCPAATVHVVVTHPDGTQSTFLIAYNGKLVFLGNGNVVHVIKEQE